MGINTPSIIFSTKTVDASSAGSAASAMGTGTLGSKISRIVSSYATGYIRIGWAINLLDVLSSDRRTPEESLRGFRLRYGVMNRKLDEEHLRPTYKSVRSMTYTYVIFVPQIQCHPNTVRISRISLLLDNIEYCQLIEVRVLLE